MPRRYALSQNRLVECEDVNAPVLVYVNPSESDRRYLLDQCGLDEHTLLSALDPDEISRVEVDEQHLAVIFKRPKSYSATDRLLFRVSSVGAFLFRDRLIVVVSEDLPLFEGKLFTRVGSLQDLMLKLLYRSIQHFIEHLRVINMISNELEAQISTSMENRVLINMFTLEKSLVYYLSAIQGNGSVIERLRINAGNPNLFGLGQEHMEVMDDLAIENKQCYEQTRIHSDILAGLMDARASVVSNNLNLLMKTLTLVMIAIMWPPLVCGFMSMNIRLPVDQTGSLVPFHLVIVLAIAPLLGAAVYYWRRSRRS